VKNTATPSKSMRSDDAIVEFKLYSETLNALKGKKENIN